MTREEAIKILQYRRNIVNNADADWCVNEAIALDLALSALRPVSRERVEKVWRGEWEMVSNSKGICSECHRQDGIDPLAKFCRYCGAPMTDEAVQMVMERMEALHGDL